MKEPFQLAAETNTLHLREWQQQNVGLVAGFTIRQGGVSSHPFASLNMGLHVGDDPERVIANRQLLSQRLHFPFAGWTCADQVHGTKVTRVSQSLRGAGRTSVGDAIAETDGLYTDQPGILLTSFYADCVPLFFLDQNKRAIGLAHAGWRGTVGQIGKHMVDAFQADFGSKPQDLWVAIGPAIGGCCYEVDEPVIRQVQSAFANWTDCVKESNHGRYLLDLAGLNEQLLRAAGVKQIVRSSWCTACRTDLFFSHRKEAGQTGRMASFIGWKLEGEHH